MRNKKKFQVVFPQIVMKWQGTVKIIANRKFPIVVPHLKGLGKKNQMVGHRKMLRPLHQKLRLNMFRSLITS